jgi:hypothetical protein
MRAIVLVSPAHRRWARCGCCGKVLKNRIAVWLGQPSFRAPAVAACLECLTRAAKIATAELT